MDNETHEEKEERLTKWRLILGKQAENPSDAIVELQGELAAVDNALAALYEPDRRGGLNSSSPYVNRWLGDIRKYFPAPMVRVMQKDALDRLNIQKMLFEPETLEALEPDVHLVATLISLQKIMPETTRRTARMVVQKVVDEIEKKLSNPLREAVQGALNRAVRNRRPKHREIDWNQTIRINLRHYQPDLKTVIPERLIGRGRKGQALRDVILLVDQSGSMASSVVYAGILGATLASLRSVKTKMVLFDTATVDVTAQLNDPIELLFCAQLGGGTDIHKALVYARQIIDRPSDTILFLISDLFEGGASEALIRQAAEIKGSGVQFISLLALSDQGAPSFDRHVAAQFALLDIPAFACTPDRFPELLAAAIGKQDLAGFAAR